MIPSFTGLLSATSIHCASETHDGRGTSGLRRTVDRLGRTWSKVSPSLARRRENRVQSPLAHERHHADRRRAATSASAFWPGETSNASESSSSIVAARIAKRSKKSFIYPLLPMIVGLDGGVPPSSATGKRAMERVWERERRWQQARPPVSRPD